MESLSGLRAADVVEELAPVLDDDDADANDEAESVGSDPVDLAEWWCFLANSSAGEKRRGLVGEPWPRLRRSSISASVSSLPLELDVALVVALVVLVVLGAARAMFNVGTGGGGSGGGAGTPAVVAEGVEVAVAAL